MSVKYMILGSLMFRCSHGYDLKSQVTQKMNREFGINDGQLYPTLKNLEEDGPRRKNSRASGGGAQSACIFDYR